VQPDLQERTTELPALAFRAAITPRSLNDEERTVDLTFATGAPVRRYDWMSGTAYIEKLSMDPAHVRLERLNGGAPLLDSHSGYRLAHVMGVVEEGTAELSGAKGKATVRFSKRADVEPFYQDVRDKVIRNVSVGYVVHAYEETPGKNGKPATRLAVDWEPYEVSLVPMPADAGAQVRAGKAEQQPELHPCRIVTRATDQGEGPAEVAPQENPPMDPNSPETLVERDPADPGAPIGARMTIDAPAAPTDADLARAAERERIEGIMSACRTAKMPGEFMDKLIRDGVSLLKAQAAVFEEMRKRGGEDRGPQHAPAARSTDIAMGDDPTVHIRAGIENALLHRVAPSRFELTDVGRKYRGLSVLDTARLFLQARGHRVTEMSKKELAGHALGLEGRAGGHSTSDFPLLLADVANKTMRRAYDEAPQTFRPLVTIGTLPDFKPAKRLQLGDAPALLEIEEDGEYTAGTIGEGKEQYALASYGRKFVVTRKALVNDDLDAFSRIPMMFGRKVRILESNLVWEQITSNPVMGDTKTLFHADHGNLQTDGDAISVESLGRARAALRQQTSLDGDYLNLTAAYLLVPTGLETKADQFVTVVTPQEAGKVNPFQNRLQVIADPRLDADSATAWYLVASPAQIDIIELAYLEGEQGPRMESRVDFDTDGVQMKCGIDVAAKVLDWRGLHKDPGGLDS
jgi:hypothetical protein